METMAGRQPRAVDASLRPLSIAFALLIWSVCCAAVSVRALPDGGSSNSNMTELQMHVSFFDRNKDGILIPLETFQGFVAIGCEIAFSTAAASTIHTALAPLTNPPGALPPYVNIYVEYIHKAIHGSDTGAYDSKGRAAAEAEWQLIYQLAHDRYGFLTKERARGIYNGNIFVELEERSRRPLHSNA
ncbi:peroxygenase-like isoform X3 [Miscanthus floridulus]|uniref:peroxygenase-like isoform X3 n=1 Tax=Miscanthus floridulus TaxID=154761 RepID=UPI00345B06AB